MQTNTETTSAGPALSRFSTVAVGIPALDALEEASSLLAIVADLQTLLAQRNHHDADWAPCHLLALAKGLLDTAVANLSREGALHD